MAKNRPRAAKAAMGRQRAATRRGARAKRYVGETAAKSVSAKQAQRERVQQMAAADAERRAEEEARRADEARLERAARLAEAEAELSRRRAAAEAEQIRRAADEREAQGLGAIFAEIVRDLARLARTIATAPFRLGLALLAPREA